MRRVIGTANKHRGDACAADPSQVQVKVSKISGGVVGRDEPLEPQGGLVRGHSLRFRGLGQVNLSGMRYFHPAPPPLLSDADGYLVGRASLRSCAKRPPTAGEGHLIVECARKGLEPLTF